MYSQIMIKMSSFMMLLVCLILSIKMNMMILKEVESCKNLLIGKYSVFIKKKIFIMNNFFLMLF